MKNIILKVLFTYIGLIAVYLVLMVLVHSIPTSKLDQNILKSTKIIQKEGLYPKILNFKLFQLDNFTDVMMLNIVASADSKEPLKAAMDNYYWRSDNFMNLANDTEKIINNDKSGLSMMSYGRYWQGYLIFLRPALLIFSYEQIRILHFILLFSLLSIASILIYKIISSKVAYVFLISLLFINFPIVPLSMQFSTVFYIAFTSIIILLLNRETFKQDDKFFILFFSIGSVTSFLDFLTAPLVTLGLPLTIYILSGEEKLKKIMTVIKASILWFVGYALTWSSKWIIGGLLTRTDIWSSAMESTAKRTSNDYRGMEMTITNIFKFIWKTIEEMNLTTYFWLGIITIILIFIVYSILLVRNQKVIQKNLFLLLIAGMVPFWYLVLRNHSIQHGWFTWRALVVSVFALILFILNTTSIKNFKLTFLKLRKHE
ncbi:hypothetical protein ACE1ET_07240 [Saccharicrinis sp. FJH62]|uniref:hypothetical protein n=1 Tax=Saccharicrinis sp. FJH62 TaxID=3344657 RepID=UPI0035D41580